MKTITFYSYKGGTGRSLTVANAALYLNRLDFKVVVVDFDLEAPGLHYKFAIDPDTGRIPVSKGLVDYIYSYISDGEIPEHIRDFSVQLKGNSGSELFLIPAGNAPEPEYWSKLSQISWHKLFYSNDSQGVELFFDFKNKIQAEFEPDFFLIDARTGITETGGVATSLLADRVICLVSSSRENLEGARAVLQSINRTRRGYQIPAAEITIALSRLPEMDKTGHESEMIDNVLRILNLESPTLEDTLSVEENDAVVLHSENSLEIHEALRVGSGVRTEDSILLRDYLRLFASIVPRNLVGSKLEVMVAKAREKIWDDPQEAVKEVEELAESFGHPDTYRELLRFYAVRNVRGPSVLRSAQRLWEISRDSCDSIIWQAIVANYPDEPRTSRDSEVFRARADFVESMWRGAGARESQFALKLAESYNRRDNPEAAARVLLELIEFGSPTAAAISRCLSLLIQIKDFVQAHELIEHFRETYGADRVFVRHWARYAVETNDREYLKTLLAGAHLEALQETESVVYLKVLVANDRKSEARELAESLLRQQDVRDYFSRIPDSYSDIADAFASVDLGSEIQELLNDVPAIGTAFRRRPARSRPDRL